MIEFNRSITNVNYFSERLRQTRQLRGMSQSELARACGLSQGAISNYENGTRRTPKGIFKLAQVLNVNPEWLGTGTGSMEPDAAPAYRLSERPPDLPMQWQWPFARITPAAFWSLGPDQREMVETVVEGVIGSFQKKPLGG
ncbi:helix-turn-helix transcriptional regulator [Parapusillimonas granuli]|uniref:helix-turn-helix domain-containing protein n=1 Tax=Parapusillimonas granuli TaxID=380911 RepID=UPI002B387417|nr:helix-turn-helix transcriptional regulator [Alcaligenaceae bacterium]